MLALVVAVVVVLITAGAFTWWLAGRADLSSGSRHDHKGLPGVSESELMQVRQERGRPFPRL